MLYALRFFSSKCSLFHNANLFGSRIIHILYTGVLKLKKKNNSGAKGLMYELKKMERYLRVNLLGPGPCLMKKRIYLGAVSQRLRNTAVEERVPKTDLKLPHE